MIKQFFTALTGISEAEYDSDESQASWELQRFADEQDLFDMSDEMPDRSDDADDSDEPTKAWWQL